MFDVGIGEVFVLLVVALLVFGPDRLPEMAKQAASFVRDLRTMVANARRDLSGSVDDLGIDKDDLKTLSDLRNPKSFVRKKVLGGVDLGLDDDEPAPSARRNYIRPAMPPSPAVNTRAGQTVDEPPPEADVPPPPEHDADVPPAAADGDGQSAAAEGDGQPAATVAADSAPSSPRFDPDAT